MPDTTPSLDGATTESTLLGGRYRLRGEIARGGMAVVHRAEDELLHREVAVKVLHDHLAHDDAFRDRFRREARAAAALSHPNIVAIYDWGEGDDAFYLVMELVDGPSLREVLVRRGRIPSAEALALLGPVADALGAAHAHGLVHRDVKPENVLIDRTTGRVKVADFGLARAIAATTQTFGPDKLVGSPHYISPEAVQGKPLDPPSDVYSLGILLFECVTGRPPFEGDTPLATALEHTRTAVPRPSSVVHGVDPAIDALVARATAMDPADRFATGNAFHAAILGEDAARPSRIDLDGSRHGTAIIPLEASDTTVVAGGRRAASGDTVTQVSAGVTPDGPGGTGGRDENADENADTNAPRGPRRVRRRLLFIALVLATLAGGGYATWATVIAPVTAIPTVVDLPVADARQTLLDLGFEVEIASEQVFERTIAAGHVARVDPAESARLGTTVVLTVSAGPRIVLVPDGLVGLPEEEAVARLVERDLVPDVTGAFHQEIAAGTVISVTPPAGESIEEGASVAVVVSQGREPVTVPGVVGMSREAALQTLAEAGLEASVAEEVFSDDVPAGQVMSQDPAAETSLFRGDSATVVVSKGQEKFDMPDVVGQQEGEATTRLRELGLNVEITEVRGFFRPAGTVASQDPKAGKKVKRGDTVTLFIWR